MPFCVDDCQESQPVLLCDGNGAMYLLAKDCSENIRDPLWLDLPPVTCLAMRITHLPTAAPHQKNKTAIIALTVQVRLTRQTSLLATLPPSSAMIGDALGGALLITRHLSLKSHAVSTLHVESSKTMEAA